MSSTKTPIESTNISLLAEQIDYPVAPNTIQEEDIFLKNMEKYIFEKNKELHSKSKLENLTLKEITENLYKVLYDIIDDIANIKFNEDNFSDKNINKKWWEKYTELFEKIIKILLIPQRAFYVGVVIIFIAFSLYFIDLTN